MSSPSVHLQTPADPSVRLSTPRSSDSKSSTFLDIVRCSRCQRSLSINGTSSPAQGVVQFGMNSYYCSRSLSNTKGKIEETSGTNWPHRLLSVYGQTDLGHQPLNKDWAEKLYGTYTLAPLEYIRRPEKLQT
ncbi:conserved hypothetical protein [Talaromyces marneffei ATCC 18224]|uniref:Uncharacterized protein n=1 Tax=Talaromyces marneffei (strain ATCC 18224 / CBS 334.59 / QM 7333) TaxID=441960 RepID=B6QMQ7_TALMQ|nr:conserved hypothetical protein [Talaromyces marneffei ATCC 18224]